MSARDDLYNNLGDWVDEREANALIDAYRSEVLREAAERMEMNIWPGAQSAANKLYEMMRETS